MNYFPNPDKLLGSVAQFSSESHNFIYRYEFCFKAHKRLFSFYKVLPPDFESLRDKITIFLCCKFQVQGKIRIRVSKILQSDGVSFQIGSATLTPLHFIFVTPKKIYNFAIELTIFYKIKKISSFYFNYIYSFCPPFLRLKLPPLLFATTFIVSCAYRLPKLFCFCQHNFVKFLRL